MPSSETDKADLLRAFERLLSRTLEMPRTDEHRDPWSEPLPVPDAHDVLVLLRSGSESAQFHKSKLRASDSAEPGDAIRDEDEQQPGKDKIIFRTKDGVETCYRNLPAVERRPSLLENSELDDAPGGIDTENRPLSDDDQWNVLLDEKASASERVTALEALRGTTLESAAKSYLAGELSRVDIPAEWRDAAVFAAEDTHFPPALREDVGEALLAIALTLRNQPDAPEKVVWSALRRAASLISATEVDRLLAFLAPGGAVDTRSVALQCVARMHEAEPPATVPVEVADRAHRFAERFLDPDVFTPGEPSLIARNAISALAAVGDPRLSEALDGLLRLERPWLVRRVKDELNRVHKGWLDRGYRQENPAVANLANAVVALG